MSEFERDDYSPEDEVGFIDLEPSEKRFPSWLLAPGRRAAHFARNSTVRSVALGALTAALLFLFLPDLIAISQPLFNARSSQAQQATNTQICSISIVIVGSPGPFRGEHYWREGILQKTAQGSECVERQSTHACTVTGGTVNEISTNMDDGTWQVVNLAGTPQVVKCG